MSARRFWILLAVLTLVAIAPIWTVALPAFGDYPNHLARAKILAHYDESAFYREFWHPTWAILPNILCDLLLVGAAKVLPIYAAGKLVISICIASLALGVAVLRRVATGAYDTLGLGGALLAYGFGVQMGFLNYTLGCGLMLLVVALHLGMRERGTGKYLAAMVPATIVLFLCHLVGFVLAMLTISALELFASGATWRARGAAIGRVVAIAIVPAILFKLSPTSGRIAVYDASSFAIKARAITMTLTVGDRITDVVFLVGFAAVVGLAWRAGYRIGRAALAALAIATGLFLVAPFGLGSQNLDTRLPFAIVLLALGLASAKNLRPGRDLAFALIAVIMLHAGLFARVQMRRGVALDRLRAQIDALPPRALLFVGTDTDAPVWRFSEWEPPLPHAHAVAVLDGERFSSGLFAIPGQQPMALRPELESLYYYQAAPALAPDRCAAEIATLLAKLPREVAGDLATRPRFLMMVGPETPVAERDLPIVAAGHRYAIYRLAAR